MIESRIFDGEHIDREYLANTLVCHSVSHGTRDNQATNRSLLINSSHSHDSKADPKHRRPTTGTRKALTVMYRELSTQESLSTASSVLLLRKSS
jgi:hypothetical protein